MKTFGEVGYAAWMAVVVVGSCVAATGCKDDETGAEQADAGTYSGSAQDAGPSVADSSTAADTVSVDDLFDRKQLLSVEVSLSQTDWDTLRAEGRTMSDVYSGCADPEFDYTMFHGDVRVNDHSFSDVGVRKKGFLGSLSTRKPSLRIEFDEFDDKKLLTTGVKTLVLNNVLQDSALITTCLAYDIFQTMGVASPHCAFAKVSVNGQLLGTYVNVEPIKKPFLERAFGDDQGDLYEGQSSADFAPDMLQFFEKKTNSKEPAKPELEALAALISKPDDELLAGLPNVLDLDAYLLYWATETLIANWDSYSANVNNFYIYEPSTSHKLTFIPWGPDGAFDRAPALLGPGPLPQTVYATGRLPARLYAIESTRERYRSTLKELLGKWDESALLAEIDALSALLGDAADSFELDKLRDFVRTRRAEVEAELAGPPPTWPVAQRAVPMCTPELVVPISGSFEANWGTLGVPAVLPNTVSIGGMAIPGMTSVSEAGALEHPGVNEPQSALNLTQVMADGSLLVVATTLGVAAPTVGKLELHGFETFGVVYQGATAETLTAIGFMGPGSITFDEASDMQGARLKGTFDAKLATFPAAPMPTDMTTP